jgi:hypothetical protein
MIATAQAIAVNDMPKKMPDKTYIGLISSIIAF